MFDEEERRATLRGLLEYAEKKDTEYARGYRDALRFVLNLENDDEMEEKKK